MKYKAIFASTAGLALATTASAQNCVTIDGATVCGQGSTINGEVVVPDTRRGFPVQGQAQQDYYDTTPRSRFPNPFEPNQTNNVPTQEPYISLPMVMEPQTFENADPAFHSGGRLSMLYTCELSEPINLRDLRTKEIRAIHSLKIEPQKFAQLKDYFGIQSNVMNEADCTPEMSAGVTKLIKDGNLSLNAQTGSYTLNIPER